MVEAGVQTSEGDRAEAMIQTEPHSSVTLRVNARENRRRARSWEEGEDNDRSPPYSLTRPSIRRRTEERGRVRAREHEEGRSERITREPVPSTSRNPEGMMIQRHERDIEQGPQISPFQWSDSGRNVQLQPATRTGEGPRRRRGR